MLVVFFVDHIIFSSQPERVVLRQMKRLRRQFAWQITNLGRISMRNKGVTGWLEQIAAGVSSLGQSPLRPVAIAEQAMGRINWDGYPAVDKAQLSVLVSRLYVVNLRLLSLRDCYTGWLERGSNPSLQLWFTRRLTVLSGLLAPSDQHYPLHLLEQQLHQLQSQIQQYRTDMNNDSVLQLALSPEQALDVYRVLAALKLLVDELKQLHCLVPDIGLGELKYRYFAVLRLSLYSLGYTLTDAAECGHDIYRSICYT